jgi:hypothetical protein
VTKVATLTANPFDALSLDRLVDEGNTSPPISPNWEMVVKCGKRISLVGLSLPLLSSLSEQS